MFPLSHIYVSTKTAKKKTPLLVFGSVLPDVSWTSKSEIGREQIHYAPNEFYKYFLDNYPQLIDLAIGVKLHSNIDNGADFYSDDTETGFAKVQGKEIEDKVVRLFDEKKSEKTLVYSHSFIEAATDILLKKSNPEILEFYHKSISEIDFNDLSNALSGYLKLGKRKILKELNIFLKFMGPEAYESYETLVDRLMLLSKARRGKDVERKGMEDILANAIDLMKDKYLDYLNNAVSHMSVDFADILK